MIAPNRTNKFKANIFVVEDCIQTRVLFTKVLDLMGFRVVGCAENGYDAIEKYKKLIQNMDICPDIILMDHHMPYKTGIEAAKEIKRINHNAKIIFISGDLQIKEQAYAVGAVDFIEKPFKISDVVKSISNALDSSQKN